MTTVAILFNDHPEHWFGYKREHAEHLRFAFAYQSDQDGDDALGEAWHLANVGDDPEFGTPDPRAVAYRAAKNRSLSVGDVVWIDSVAYSVDPFGFTRLDTIEPPARTKKETSA